MAAESIKSGIFAKVLVDAVSVTFVHFISYYWSPYSITIKNQQ